MVPPRRRANFPSRQLAPSSPASGCAVYWRPTTRNMCWSTEQSIYLRVEDERCTDCTDSFKVVRVALQTAVRRGDFGCAACYSPRLCRCLPYPRYRQSRCRRRVQRRSLSCASNPLSGMVSVCSMCAQCAASFYHTAHDRNGMTVNVSSQERVRGR